MYFARAELAELALAPAVYLAIIRADKARIAATVYHIEPFLGQFHETRGVLAIRRFIDA